jgi:hypothetical protein
MSTQSLLSQLNKFINETLNSETLNNENVLTYWNSSSNQNQLKKVLNKTLTKSSKETKVKDPDRPKRSKSAYLYFCEDMREHIKKEFPNMNAKELTTELGSRWNQVKDDKIKISKYTKQADDDKQRYSKQMTQYVVPEQYNRKKKFDGPKRSKSAYLYFCEEQRRLIQSENPNMNVKQITTELGKRWNQIKEDKKKITKYTKQADDDKQRYTYEKESFVNEQNEKEIQKKSKNLSNQTPYYKFCQTNRTLLKLEYPDKKPSEITQLINQKWKALSNEEQKSFGSE